MPALPRIAFAVPFAFVAAGLLLLLAACGTDEPTSPPPVSFVGTWTLDAEATHARMKEAGMLGDLAAIQATRMVIELRVDGSYVGTVTEGEVTSGASGTWKAEEEELTLTVLSQNGKPAEPPTTKSGRFKDGRLRFDADAQTAPLVFRRR